MNRNLHGDGSLCLQGAREHLRCSPSSWTRRVHRASRSSWPRVRRRPPRAAPRCLRRPTSLLLPTAGAPDQPQSSRRPFRQPRAEAACEVALAAWLVLAWLRWRPVQPRAAFSWLRHHRQPPMRERVGQGGSEARKGLNGQRHRRPHLPKSWHRCRRRTAEIKRWRSSAGNTEGRLCRLLF